MLKGEKFLHTTKDGVKMKLSEMKTSHIKNTINVINRMAKEGVTIRSGGGSCPDDFWYDEDVLFGEEALVYLNYYYYVEELKRRAKC